MKCQFEEKQYEQHLNNELVVRNDRLYVPGQVLESQLGFDAALYSHNRTFWRLFHDFPLLSVFFPLRYWTRHHRPGVNLCIEWWNELEAELPYFPQFRFNVFVQHKRPEYLTVSSSCEWACWNRPYFRYPLTLHEQLALEKLESCTQNSALVVYASPAFVKLKELWDTIEQRQLIAKSNFCQPSKLKGHHRYSYADPGNTGKAHSETEEIELYDFYERLTGFLDEVQTFKDNRQFLIALGDILQDSIDGCGRLSNDFDIILGAIDLVKGNEFHLAMARISAFNLVVGTNWYISIAPQQR